MARHVAAFYAFVFSLLSFGGTFAMANDKLVIISPHPKSIQQEYVPAFTEYYKKTFNTDIDVDWLDQGGTTDNINFLKARIAKFPKSADIDIFWGGGTAASLELQRENLLEKYSIPPALKAQLPKSAAGVPLYDNTETWYAAALSTFGIFYNKKIIKTEKLREPGSWQDLTSAKYFNQIIMTDPRRSGTATAIVAIVLQGLGWNKGWELLTVMAANTRSFTHSSFDPIKAVAKGDVAAATAIDFYAYEKIAEIGKETLGFSVPKGQLALDPDPITILHGAPNRKQAERFVDFVLSVQGQKLLMLPVGVQGGPKQAALARMAVNTQAYSETKKLRLIEMNPFKQKSGFKMDTEKMSKFSRPLEDLIGAIHVDTNKELKVAWEKLLKSGKSAEKLSELGEPFVTEKELLAMSENWDNEAFRNQAINNWVKGARARYAKILAE
jgi:ABC-type Fe3+ transport system substrate-binding protein